MRVESGPPKTRERSHSLNTLLQGRMTMLARVGWFVLVIVTLIIFIASLPVNLAQLETPCSGSTCWYTQLSPEQVEVLKGIGLSLGHYVAYTITATVASILVSLVVSALIIWRKADDPMAICVAFLLVTFGPIFTTHTVMASSSPWQVPNQCLTFLALGLLMLVFLLFPSGQFVPRWTRKLFFVFLLGLIPGIFIGSFLPNSVIDQLGFVVIIGELATVAFVQIYRYRRISNSVQRQQTKWVVWFIVVLGIFSACGVASRAIIKLFGNPDMFYWQQLAFNALGIFFPLFFPLSFGFAILYSRLWEIDILINRTLVYSLLTASVIGVYVVVVSIPSTLLNTSGNFLISLIATGIVAILFQPLRARLQRIINRLMYGERDDPYAVLSRLLNRLEATLAPEGVLPTIVESVAQALKLPYTAITLKQGDIFTPAATFGRFQSQDKPLTLPLVYQTEIIGQLLLAPRAPGEAFSATDRKLLEDLARQAGVAVHALRLTADLQRSREQLVTAREEERRRLRRDLHDGLGSSLASLSFKVDAARNLLSRDSARVETLLAEVREQAQQAISDIRHLVYNLRPPALDEMGLLSALREQGVPYHHQGLTVIFDLPEVLPILPAAVEVAVYRITQEALTNVARHAKAQRCLLRLYILRDVLYLDISDDGKGIATSHNIGIGLHAMQERASELGGSCTVIKDTSGGTQVQVILPLPRVLETGLLTALKENKADWVEE